MRKLYLHIGTEKTGTTTLQSFFKKNKKVLRDHNLLYLDENVFRFAASFSSLDKKLPFDPDQLKIIQKGIVSEISNSDCNVLISCEWFHSRVNTYSEILQVKEFFTPYFDQIYVICYLRNQVEMIPSAYSTSLKCRDYISIDNIYYQGMVPSFDNYFKMCTPEHQYFNYYSFIRLWLEMFGRDNLYIRRFNRSDLYLGDVVKDFLTLIDLPLEGYLDVDNKNESLTIFGESVLACYDELLSESKVNRNLLVRSFTGKGRKLSYQEACIVYNDFNNSNIELNNILFGVKENFFGLFVYPKGINLTDFSNDANTVLDLLSNYSLTNNEIDLLRDLAIDLESYNIKTSLSLMSIVSKFRPKGKLVERKISEYRKLVGEC